MGDSMTITINGTTGITSPGGDLSVSQGLSGNLNFTGTGNRITGDFSNATVASRVLLQSSTTNGQSALGLLPNGTSTQTQYLAFNSTDPANSSYIQALISATEARINSGQLGTGTNLPMTFYTGGSERVRIDTSGNVGIGVTPAYRLSSKQSGNTGSASLGVVSINSANDTFIGIGYDSASDTNRVLASFTSTGAFKPISFWTSDSQRMQIDTSGNLLVGRTTNYGDGSMGTPLVQTGGVAGSKAGLGVIQNSTASTSAIGFANPNGFCGDISTSGTSTAYNTSSDYRLKENIAPMTGALEKVATLKPCTYTWKADGSAGQGFIAHELQAVVPYCVTGTKDAVDKDGKPKYQGVDTSFLVATLVSAIQELTARLEALENK
jgi:hypothetical protein